MGLDENIKSSVPEKKVGRETTPENLEVFSSAFEKINKMTKANYEKEGKEKEIFDKHFTKNFDKIWRTCEIWDVEIKENTVNFTETKMTKWESEKTIEKQQLLEYATLANLAYATFEKVNKDWWTTFGNLKVKDANLDFASIDFKKFENLDKYWKIDVLKIPNLNDDERFIVSYVNSHIVDTTNEKKLVQFASAEIKKDTMTDAIKDYWIKWVKLSETEQKEVNKILTKEALIKLKEKKTSEYSIQFEKLKQKWDLKVLAFYPEEGSKDTGWFQCTLFENNWKKILSIAWTNDIQDWGADFNIWRWKIPETQTKRMIDFFEKHLNWSENITVVGHSLGWNLSQIATSIYWDTSKVKEVYTFNCPGAKELEFSLKPDDKYKKEFDNFANNRKSDTIEKKITNVKWIWYSPISEEWVDIWNYRIDVNTTSHSIIDVIKAIEGMDKIVRYTTIKQNRAK